MECNRFKGKTVIVTGAAKGIGKSTSMAFAEEGAIVILADCDGELGKKTAKEITNMGADALFIEVDISSREDCYKMVETVLEKYKKLDCLVNIAGVISTVAAKDVTEEDWDFVMNINLKGLFWCCQAAGIQMLKQNYGSIVNISSVSAYHTRELRSIYSTSKAGVSMLTKALAVEWGKNNVRVNAVAPGIVKTPLSVEIMNKTKGLEEKMAATTVLKRIGSPEEIASLILYLSSDDAGFITGQTTIIDGGRLAYGRVE